MSIREWSNLLAELEKITREIQQNNMIIARGGDKLRRRNAAPKDVLTKISAASHDNTQCATRMGSALKDLERLAPLLNKQTELRRLQQTIPAVLAQFEAAQKQAAAIHEQVCVPNSRHYSGTSCEYEMTDADEQRYEEERLKLLSAKATTKQRQNELAFASTMLAERGQSLQEIEQSIKDVHEIMGDINMMLGEQGAGLNEMEVNVTTAHSHTERAAEELQTTQSATRSSRKRLLFMLCVFSVGLVLLIVFSGALRSKPSTVDNTTP
eukprot:PhM_4_TR2299/c0_g1_i1/m.70128/K13813/STX12, STX13; syntaxin 12/13